MRPMHCRLEIVRHHTGRHPAQRLKRVHVPLNPRTDGLVGVRFGEDIMAVAEDCHKDLRGPRFAGVPIDDGYRGTGVIHKDFVARLMRLAENDVEPFAPAVVVHAERRVLQGIVAMLPLIFEPGQFQRHALDGP